MSALRKEWADGRVVYPVRVVIRDGEICMVRVCSRCGREKRVSEDKSSGFYPKRDSDGVCRRWKATCKVCAAAVERARRQRNRDAENAKRRARYRGAMEDPETVGILRDRRRVGMRATRARDPEKSRRYSRDWSRAKRREDPTYFTAARKAERMAARPRATEPPRTVPRVPSAPFGVWLEVYQARTGLSGADALADGLGICVKRVQAALGGLQEHITVDVVDRALLNAWMIVEVEGRPVVSFDDLYPDTAAGPDRVLA